MNILSAYVDDGGTQSMINIDCIDVTITTSRYLYTVDIAGTVDSIFMLAPSSDPSNFFIDEENIIMENAMVSSYEYHYTTNKSMINLKIIAEKIKIGE